MVNCMSKLEFIAICNEYGIAPPTALENDNIIDLLRQSASSGDDVTEQIRNILESEY